MARRPRIEIAGYYHIINRGVEQRVIFKEASDYEQFEELMCFYKIKGSGDNDKLSKPTLYSIQGVKHGKTTTYRDSRVLSYY